MLQASYKERIYCNHKDVGGRGSWKRASLKDKRDMQTKPSLSLANDDFTSQLARYMRTGHVRVMAVWYQKTFQLATHTSMPD